MSLVGIAAWYQNRRGKSVKSEGSIRRRGVFDDFRLLTGVASD